jgi:hypothetical protein
MTDGHTPQTPQSAGDGSPPFDPFTLEPQKAHISTGSAAPPPIQHAGRRRFGIPAPVLGLLLALAVAVPTIVATSGPAGQESSDGGADSSVQKPAPADPAPPSEGFGEQAEPLPPPTARDAPDASPLPPVDPPNTDPGRQHLLAVEDCVENALALRAACDVVLGEDSRAAARYLDCREVGLTADRCLEALPPR